MHPLFLGLMLLVTLVLEASQIPDFHNLSNTKGAIILMSTKRSGSNLVSGSLSAITRKPISWIEWENRIFESDSKFKTHMSYNRLKLPLISDQPLLYRTHHQFEKLKQIPSHLNQLIFVTRNPKELIFREFFLIKPGQEILDSGFIEEFLKTYLLSFEIYEAWDRQNRLLVFYEDFICHSDEMLLSILAFMREKPLFFEDYCLHREEYVARLLESYKIQHKRTNGGASSIKSCKAIYYTMNVPIEMLLHIDAYLEKEAPLIWKKYLKRFKTDIR